MASALKIEQTAKSIEARDHHAWEPDWIEERFVGFLRCSNAACHEIMAFSGVTKNEEYYYQQDHPPYEYEHGLTTTLIPKYVAPAPFMFHVPAACPSAVREELIAAFTLYWVNHTSCAARLRSALEALMNHLRVPRSSRTPKGKLKRLDLHTRIEKLRPKAPQVAEHLLAAKWIGNAGAHSSPLTQNDIFDAMDLIEYSLEEAISNRSKRLNTVAKSITKRKRPRGK